MKLGLDVGGTKTDAVAVVGGTQVSARVRLPTAYGPDGVVRTVLDAVSALQRQGVDATRIDSVGIGIPGQVVPGTARVQHAVNLGVSDLDLGTALTPQLRAPVRVENDVKAAAMGACALRGSSAAESIAYLNLGTGVAAGVVHDGLLWQGSHGTAGEVGHISVDPHGPVCRCGQRGCVEALCGGAALAERWDRVAALPVLDIVDAADAGDAAARRLRDDLMRGAAAAVRILVLTCDVDVVVVGGGISSLGDRLITGVVAALADSAKASAFLQSLRLPERVELLPAGSAAAAVGAALIGAGDGLAHESEEELIHG